MAGHVELIDCRLIDGPLAGRVLTLASSQFIFHIENEVVYHYESTYDVDGEYRFRFKDSVDNILKRLNA